ncbi:hypothetical protein [Glycomyces arizonensis]|uniref:hypothetical protein n=1 Tax=Glycomyces arizonensis TaxID=256035 RepID=UPI0012EB794E|nr:hypothetical protein [Glycomyces arizonensis]
MERNDLLNALNGSSGIEEQARRAIEDGDDFEIWPRAVAKSEILTIYSRRLRLLSKNGQPSVGFAEAIESIRSFPEDRLRIGYVDDRPRGGYYFQLFLSPEDSVIVACFGVQESIRERWKSR